MNALNLSRDAAGILLLTDANGASHKVNMVVRAYPISAPDDGVSLLGIDGHELAWIANLQALSEGNRSLINNELAQREFMPQISHIQAVSSYATPSTWTISTDRGDTELVLSSEDHIRHLAHNRLLITDALGISYLIADMASLSKHSRKILDRFL
ncbi:MAG: DUF1854 domain-containing protein [Sideroxydans sp.]|nr:DUF1854 domain-containing protein [Sideroxydans sp.]